MLFQTMSSKNNIRRNSLEGERNHQKGDESGYRITDIMPINFQDTKGFSIPLMISDRWGSHLRIIKEPTIVNAPPVAHGGNDEKMGAKKMDMKNMIPVVMAVNPVLPPSAAIMSGTALKVSCRRFRTTNTRGGFNAYGYRASTEKGTQGNTEGEYTVCCRRTFEIEGGRVLQAGDFSHGGKGTERWVNCRHDISVG